MVESGLSDLLVGLETPNQAALDNVGKSFIRVENLEGYVSKIQSLGVAIDASFLFGFDEHERDVFEKTLQFAAEVGIAHCHGVILTPFPGTPLYNEIVSEDRLLTREYSKYDCTHAVFKPKHMTAQELEQGTYWFDIQFERIRKGLKVSTPSPTAGDKSELIDHAEGIESSHNNSGSQESLGNAKSVNLNHSEALDIPDLSSVNVGYKKKVKWLAISGLLLVVVAIAMDWPVLFGVLYLTWAFQDIKSGYAFILEDVGRDENPVLYWLTVSIWLLSGLYVLAEPLIYKLYYMN